jgi:hypothetical protein
MPYRIDFSEQARTHLHVWFTAGEQRLILQAVVNQLRHQPAVATRNRFRIQPNPLAAYELRVRQFRVFYDVIESPEPVVQVVAIGTKAGNRLIIAGQEVSTHA